MEFEEETGKYVQLYKAGLNDIGRPAGPPRQPRLPLAGAELDRLRQYMAALSEAEIDCSGRATRSRFKASTGTDGSH